VLPPPLRFPEPVRRDLDAHKPGLADETERKMALHARPCVAITSRRVSTTPMRRNRLLGLFGAQGSAPLLGPLESKFGGTPYCESGESWSGYQFLGQLDLERATAVLPEGARRLKGLLRLDLRTTRPSLHEALRVRWYPAPALERAVAAEVESTGAWEARLEFALGWTLPDGAALEALWPLREPRWYEYDRFDPEGYNGDASDAFHRLLGHKCAGLDDPYDFTPPPGCSAQLADYESLLRLTFDNAAGFAWGTNWLYLLVQRSDLERGDLGRVLVTGANS
jgi:Domain of unknown function (DUF1963)